MRGMHVLAALFLVFTAVSVSAVEFRVTGGESMGIPFWLSADLGVVMGSSREDGFSGLKISGEIGIGGTKGFLGYYTCTKSRFAHTSFAVGPAFMRTFGSPLLADDWRSFLGVEAQLSYTGFLPVTLRLGVYSWTEEFHPQFTFGFGFGI